MKDGEKQGPKQNRKGNDDDDDNNNNTIWEKGKRETKIYATQIFLPSPRPYGG